MQATWVDRAIIEPTRASTEALSSTRGKPDPDAAPIVYYVDFDGYYFVGYAQEIARGQGPRIRWTQRDNAPDGRAVHWSSAFPWWLVGLGALHGTATGQDVDDAIASAAYYANPLWFAATVTAAGAAVWWVAGGIPGAALALTLATHPKLLEDFGYAKPDHHGLHISFALGLLLCAVLAGAGWVDRDRSFDSARRWMIASGIFGGLGLWAGATQTSVVIASVGVGAALAMWRDGRDEAGFHPELWRSWAWAGAATSLVAFAVEYLPDHAFAGNGMRLEVNHPLHALSWFCAGHLLASFGLWRRAQFVPSATGLIAIAASLIGIFVLPLLVAFGPVHWFWPKDPYMLNLHERIAEFGPFFADARPVLATLYVLGLPALAALGCCWLLRPRPGTDGHELSALAERASAWLVCVPCGILFLWVVAQGRWLGLFAAAGSCALALLCTVAADNVRQSRSRVSSAALLAAVALIGLANLAPIGNRLLASMNGSTPGTSARQSQTPLALDVYLRDLALNLCPEVPHRSVVRILAGPTETALLHHFGKCRGVGSPFWENVAGVRAMADFYTATDDAEGRRIAAERQIDFVLIANNVPFVEYMDLTRYGAVDTQRASQSLGYRLLHNEAPEWLTPVQVRDWPAARFWRLFRVTLDPAP